MDNTERIAKWMTRILRSEHLFGTYEWEGSSDFWKNVFLEKENSIDPNNAEREKTLFKITGFYHDQNGITHSVSAERKLLAETILGVSSDSLASYLGDTLRELENTAISNIVADNYQPREVELKPNTPKIPDHYGNW